MITENFPKCCGVLILSDFGNNNTSINKTKYTKQEIIDYLDTELIKNEYRRKAVYIATLNNDQLDFMKNIFIERGFVISEPNYHPIHNSYIYILTKKMYPDVQIKEI